MIRFNGFTLDNRRKTLAGPTGERVELPLKTIEILCVLVEHAGEVMPKDDLMAAVWTDSFVEEGNLSHHIFRLRKALGDSPDARVIETVPKRGYRFAASVEGEVTQPPAAAPPATKKPYLVAALLAAVALAVVVWLVAKRYSPIPPTPPAQVRSLAVMPFVNESGSEDVEYLADGMTETLIASLAETGGLAVKPRTAVAKFKGADISASAAAEELKVDIVLFGRITQRNDQLTLFLSLIDPTNEYQIWGRQYNRKLSELSALQNEIGRDVAQGLEARLFGPAQTNTRKRYSDNAEAYRLYLLGDYHWAKFTEKSFWIAKKHYEDAIAIDPNYALAYTGLSNTYSVLGVNGHIPADQGYVASKAAAERALALDDRLAEARVSSGAVKLFFEWDLYGAETEFLLAAQLDENYAVPHELLAYVYRSRLEHEKAIAAAKRATEIDPLHLLMLGDLGTCYRFAGEPRRSIEINRKVMEMDPSFGDVYLESALAHSQLGEHAIAIEHAKKGLELAGGTKIEAGLGIVYGRAGDKANAQAVVARLIKKRETVHVSPLDIALVYAGMNDKERAFEWLEKAYAERSPWLMEINVDPMLEPLRGDPRFTDLARRVFKT